MTSWRRIVINRWTFLFAVVVFGSAQFRPGTPPGALPGLTRAQNNAFTDGQTAFRDQETPQGGLGPIFNGRSCDECHPNGGGSAIISNIVGTGTAGQWNAGGPVIQLRAINNRFTPEPVPSSIPVGERRTMTTRGLGLIGAITDNAILAEQARQQSQTPLIAGRANIVTDAVTGNTQRVGRVGQKCQHPNSTSFAAEAYLREMGITTPFFPTEEAPFNNASMLNGNPVPGINDDGEDVIRFGLYMDFLAPPTNNPPRNNSTRNQVNRGVALFNSIGCSGCHKQSYTTGSHSVAALSGKVVTSWSDYLLHDMGSSGDQIQQGTDSNGQPIPGSWMRTTPLWGCRTNPRLWHDGSVRQADYAGAINRHNGQGAASKAAFQSLSNTDKQALTAFINSL